jgi:hypothetical protein
MVGHPARSTPAGKAMTDRPAATTTGGQGEVTMQGLPSLRVRSVTTSTAP